MHINNANHASSLDQVAPGITDRSDHASNDGVTAIIRGTQQIWKPYSAAYIGSL